jgi:hypothetical protein
VTAAVAEVAVVAALGGGTWVLAAMILVGLGGLGALAVRRRQLPTRPDDVPAHRGRVCERRPVPARPERIAPWCVPASPEWRPRSCPRR